MTNFFIAAAPMLMAIGAMITAFLSYRAKREEIDVEATARKTEADAKKAEVSAQQASASFTEMKDVLEEQRSVVDFYKKAHADILIENQQIRDDMALLRKEHADCSNRLRLAEARIAELGG